MRRKESDRSSHVCYVHKIYPLFTFCNQFNIIKACMSFTNWCNNYERHCPFLINIRYKVKAVSQGVYEILSRQLNLLINKLGIVKLISCFQVCISRIFNVCKCMYSLRRSSDKWSMDIIFLHRSPQSLCFGSFFITTDWMVIKRLCLYSVETDIGQVLSFIVNFTNLASFGPSSS